MEILILSYQVAPNLFFQRVNHSLRENLVTLRASCVNLSFRAAENLCLNEQGDVNRLKMAETAGLGIYNANAFYPTELPDLWDSKEVVIEINKLHTLTVEYQDGDFESPTSYFYKSTINVEDCKVLKVEEVKSL